MKVLHIAYTFYPDAIGGTEIYVKALAEKLQSHGMESVIAAPGRCDSFYVHEGLSVYRLGASQMGGVSELYGAGDTRAAAAFARVMDRERPDVVHLHAFTREVSIRVAEDVKRRGVPLVFTYHIPTNSCVRHTLLRWGTEVCDGRLDLRKCAACKLQSLKLPKAIARGLAFLPAEVGSLIERTGFSGDLCTALRMTQLVAMRHDSFRALVERSDVIVAPCDWARSVLLRNGVPSAKIVCSRQGLCQRVDRKPHIGRRPGQPLRVAFLGRLTPLKGPDTVVRAIRSRPGLRLQLDVFGVGQDDDSFRRYLQMLAAGDPRIEFRRPVRANDVVSLLRNYDVLAVPSAWLETGPLVVLEAFAAGVPVLGSDLGGIAELVTDGIDGVLVRPADSVSAWCEALKRLCANPEIVTKLRAGIRFPRTMESVASEMKDVYRGLAFAPAPEFSESGVR